MDVPNMLKLNVPQTGLISFLSLTVLLNPGLGTLFTQSPIWNTGSHFWHSFLPPQVQSVPKSCTFLEMFRTHYAFLPLIISILFQIPTTLHHDHSKGLPRSLTSSLTTLESALTMQLENKIFLPEWNPCFIARHTSPWFPFYPKALSFFYFLRLNNSERLAFQ